MSTELKQKLDELGTAFEEFKETNDKRLEEIKKNGAAAPETIEKLARLETAIGGIEDVKERLEKVELDRNRPGKGQDESPEAAAHRKAFLNFVRNPTDPSAVTELKAAETAAGLHRMEVKGTDNAAGGHAVPEEISRDISSKIIDLSPMFRLAKVVRAGTRDYKELVNVRGAAGGWVGETDTRNDSATSQLEEVAPTFGMSYAYPKATEESLQDIFFDVERWIVEEAAVALAKQEGAAFISGNGTKKPTGMLAGSTAATSDEASPARAFGTIEHIATGVAAAFGNDQTGSPPGNPGDVLMDVIHALKKGYRQNAMWLMNKSTLGTVRKFKDKDGNYLWQPGLAAGQPNTLAGYGVEEDEEMADIGANALPIAFGDFRAAYVIVQLAGMRITRDEITTPGYVKFYVRRRVGGKLLNDDAVKVVKVATS